jgi:phage shock protein C
MTGPDRPDPGAGPAPDPAPGLGPSPGHSRGGPHGHRAHHGPPPPPPNGDPRYAPGDSPNPHRLYRNRQRRVLAGVCAGFADYLGLKAWQTRAIAVLALVFFLPQTLLVYGILAVVLKPRPEQLYRSTEEERFWRSVSGKPDATFHGLRHRFRELEARLGRMERHVTSDEYELKRKFDAME